jgi:hypothetical protein
VRRGGERTKRLLGLPEGTILPKIGPAEPRPLLQIHLQQSSLVVPGDASHVQKLRLAIGDFHHGYGTIEEIGLIDGFRLSTRAKPASLRKEEASTKDRTIGFIDH